MGAGEQRPPANRMMLQMYKARKVGAKKGHGLLKKKRDALKARFQKMLREMILTKKKVGVGMKEAAFSYAKANWAAGGADISTAVLERARKPSVTIKTSADNVAGVYLPTFNMAHDPNKDSAAATLGVAAGGQVIQSCRETHLKTIQMIIKMASLQTSFVTLDEEIKMTSRRVNALEYVIIPQIDSIIAYINQEMDEQAREEFFRVKKVVEKKKQRLAREKEEDDAREAEAAAKSGKPPPSAAAQVAAQQPESMIGQKDPDVIF